MPLFEFRCKQCGKVSEQLMRSEKDRPVCECGSRDLEKLISSFAVSSPSAVPVGGCSDGSCSIPSSPCASGMCGM